MNKGRRTIAAGEFKARGLHILDQVASSGESIVVTKRGKPVAQVISVEATQPAPWGGSVTCLGDIIRLLEEM